MRKNVSFNLEQCYNNHYQLIFLLLFFCFWRFIDINGYIIIYAVTCSSLCINGISMDPTGTVAAAFVVFFTFEKNSQTGLYSISSNPCPCDCHC